MQDVKTIRTELLVIGSGLAGLRAAAAAAEAGVQVTVVSKGQSASPEVMGFDVPVVENDTRDLYYKDTEISAHGINNSSLGWALTNNVRDQVTYLESIGVVFDKNEKGEYDAIHTLGTVYPRLIHCKSRTGTEGMLLLSKHCKELGVEIQNGVSVLTLLTDGNQVLGGLAYDKNDDQLVCYLAKAVVLATGGCGAIQKVTTYPKTIIGDGYAMAFRAGVDLVDMEFQQFEPCAFVYPPAIEGKVIATTLLRHGAALRNGNGEEFMQNYGLTRANAQKSTLSRAMVAEVRAGRGTPHGGIYYDMTMLPPKFLYEDDKIFTRPAVEVGMDLTKDMPEMMPAAHTNLGGVRIAADCSTQIPNLFAAGEVIGGLHGANRIGGSAGAETVVFGAIAGTTAAAYLKNAPAYPEDVQETVDAFTAKLCRFMDRPAGEVTAADIAAELGQIMERYVGIDRDEAGLLEARKLVAALEAKLEQAGAETLKENAQLCHCENMLLLSKIQIEASLMRQESRGVFYRNDYPEQNDEAWRKTIVVHNREGGLELEVCDPA